MWECHIPEDSHLQSREGSHQTQNLWVTWLGLPASRTVRLWMEISTVVTHFTKYVSNLGQIVSPLSWQLTVPEELLLENSTWGLAPRASQLCLLWDSQDPGLWHTNWHSCVVKPLGRRWMHFSWGGGNENNFLFFFFSIPPTWNLSHHPLYWRWPCDCHWPIGYARHDIKGSQGPHSFSPGFLGTWLLHNRKPQLNTTEWQEISQRERHSQKPAPMP